MRIYIKFVIDKYLEIAEYKALCNGLSGIITGEGNYDNVHRHFPTYRI